MRVGLSWDFDSTRSPVDAWNAVLAEMQAAEGLGYDSAWVEETRSDAVSCTVPSVFLTNAAPKVQWLQLRAAGRTVGHHHPARIAEEVALLDLQSRGRAGISFAAASRQGLPPGHVHEVLEFIQAAWSTDELRFRGTHLRFPAHTGHDAPLGASEPASQESYIPQWEWGPATPDFLAVTPKPFVPRPPVYVEIDDEPTLEWAARRGVSPYVSVRTSTPEAVDRLARYRARADAAGLPRWAVEPVLERRVAMDGQGDDTTLGGAPMDIVNEIRAIKVRTGISHFVWRRGAVETGRTDLLFRFASEVQPLLQA